MKVFKLHLKNFINISEADFDFSDDVNFIYGEPASGKSAIFEAMMVTLSTQKRSTTYGEYVKQGEDLAEIHLEAELFGQKAVFDTTINRVKGAACQRKLEYNGETFENEYVENWLKLRNIDYYAKLTFAMQNEVNIVDITASERLAYIQKLFNFDFKKQKETLKTEQKEIEESLVRLNSKINGNKSTIDIISVEQKTENRKLTDELRQEYEKTISEKLALIEENQKTQEAINSLNAKVNELSFDIIGYQNKIKDIENILVSKKENEEEIKTLSKEIEDLENSINERTDEKEKKQKLSNELETEKLKLSISKEDIAGKVAELNSEIKEVNSKLELVKKGVCPHCGQPTHNLDNNLDEKLFELQQELNTKTEEQKKVLSDLLKLENEYNSNYKNLSEINAKLSNDTFNKSSKENKLSVLKTKTFESCDDIEEIKTKIKGLTSEKENIQKELEGYKDIKNTKDLLNEIEPLKTAINEDNIIIEKNALIMKTNLDNKNKCLELEAENLKLLEEIGVLNNKISSIKEAYDYLNRLLPQFISKSICDNLENRINHFIHKIFPKYEVKLETNEKGCELFYTKDKTIMDEKRNKFIKTRMSSGLERSILNLAFKVSLAESYNLEMFVGDEIDQSSNDRDAKILMDLLINSNSFEQLFIISHKPAVLEHISDNYKGNIYLADNGKFTKSSF